MYRVCVIILLILILLSTCSGCDFMVAKDTVKVVDIITTEDKNPEKKKKILDNKNKKKNSLKERARKFYCEKVKDPIKCVDYE